ncbi:MAG: hypothetical protein Q8O99_08345 [bacterium]|nr:hypothetical protein [bacterium]
MGDILTRYEIGTVVLGKPLTPFAQQHISVLQDTLIAIDSSIEIHMADEAYTSVQADVLLETSVDHPGQDTVAAMKFLEFFVDTKSQHSSSH